MNNLSSIKIEPLSHESLNKFRDRLCQIYLDAFTTGEYSHNFNKLTPDCAFSVFHSILGNDLGFGYAAFDDGKIASPYYPIGFVFGMSFSYDPLVEQTAIPQDYELNKCLYLAELAVDQAHKGRKIGRSLVSAAVQRASKFEVPMFVRTNEHSLSLHKFYEGCGFKKLQYVALRAQSVKKRYFVVETNGQNITKSSS